MPGKEEALEDAVAEVRRLGISLIVSLVPPSEIRVNSPASAKAIEAQDLPGILVTCPIPAPQPPTARSRVGPSRADDFNRHGDIHPRTDTHQPQDPWRLSPTAHTDEYKI
jgi:hypothetical protein